MNKLKSNWWQSTKCLLLINGLHCKPPKDTRKAISTECELVPGSSYSLFKHKDAIVVDRDNYTTVDITTVDVKSDNSYVVIHI